MVGLEDKVLIICERSFFGRSKIEFLKNLDSRFGAGNWTQKWLVDGELKSKKDILKLYEDSYYFFFKKNPHMRNWIVKTANEVYDITSSNISSGMDYTIQECESIHLQDISIRRALTRLKLEESNVEFNEDNLPVIKIFEGNRLVQVRGHRSEGYFLNPGKVPFHKPELIIGNYADCRGKWWDKNSVEDFYQRNKALIVDPERIILTLDILGQEDCFFHLTHKDYYHVNFSNPNQLFYTRGNNARRHVSGVKEKKHFFVRPQITKKYPELLEEINHFSNI